MNILEVSHINKIYSGGKVALKDLSLNIKKGSFVGLLGPNGAGKSTFINIISDVVKKDSGKIILNGLDFDSDLLNFKRSIGIVPQDLVFDPFLTPFETLRLYRGFYGLPEDNDYVMYLLEKVALCDKAHINNRRLSGGMKRRVLVAKAMVHDPEMIVLDEPTAGVDIELRQNLWKFLQELNSKGKTIVLTTHYLEEAQYLCDNIAIINNGELVTHQSKKDLFGSLGNKELILTLDKVFSDKILIEEEGISVNVNDNKLIVNYGSGEIVANIITKVSNAGYQVLNIDMQESSLEDIFLKLTM